MFSLYHSSLIFSLVNVIHPEIIFLTNGLNKTRHDGITALSIPLIFLDCMEYPSPKAIPVALAHCMNLTDTHWNWRRSFLGRTREKNLFYSLTQTAWRLTLSGTHTFVLINPHPRAPLQQAEIGDSRVHNYGQPSVTAQTMTPDASHKPAFDRARIGASNAFGAERKPCEGEEGRLYFSNRSLQGANGDWAQGVCSEVRSRSHPLFFLFLLL